MKSILIWLAAEFSDPVNAAAQIIGFIPMILAYFVFLFNDRRKVIAFKASSDLLWALHFLLLGELSGCVINSINVVRNIIFAQKDKKWASSIAIPVVFCIITAVGALLSRSGLKSIFPLIGSCLAVMGFWCNEPRHIRKFNLPAVSLWLIYGLLTGSISTIICNIMSFVSILTAELRLIRNKAG
ncbi:MAG: YgjV family protein [Clostridia bacterium]|nr:YgjV family protein [Clostridia bacterium]